MSKFLLIADIYLKGSFQTQLKYKTQFPEIKKKNRFLKKKKKFGQNYSNVMKWWRSDEMITLNFITYLHSYISSAILG